MRGQARRGTRSGSVAAAFLAGVAALACSTGGPPVPDSGFLPEPQRMTARPERFPFYRVWIKPGVPREQFKRVLIQPVSTDYLLGIDWTREQRSTRESAKIQHTANRLARYAWQSLRGAFYYDPNHRFELVERRGPDTLILEMALVYVRPGAFGRGEIAMEARLRDAQTREIIGMFRDQRSGGLEGIIDRWGLQLIELINTPVDYQVRDS